VRRASEDSIHRQGLRPRHPRETLQRWASIGVGVVVVFIVGWMTYAATEIRPIKKETDAATSTVASASPSAGPDASAEADAGALAADGHDGGLFLTPPSLGDAGLLPTGGPRNVRIGVVLVAYKGAEGAGGSARSAQEARGIADRLAQTARTDFHAAVGGGDPGSADDIGKIPRGVLDPRTEGAVFALAAGDVSEVLETPKGYWIVKRIE
jgi:hypothetical protein